MERERRAMCRWLILVLLVSMSTPSWAAKRGSVVELEKVLSAMVSAHRTDAESANRIGLLMPSERISDATLARLTKQYAHGPRSSVALQLMADRSSFLKLPAGEMLPDPAPSPTTQHSLIESARRSAIEMAPRLPDLFATRTNYGFNDSPVQLKSDTWPIRVGLHLVDTEKDEVNLRNEQESIALSTLQVSHRPKSLETWGEFGSALLMVLNDSAKGEIVWSHWEQSPAGRVAVFSYSVPKSASHYRIEMPADAVPRRGAGESARWSSALGYYSPEAVGGTRMLQTGTGYHGSLWIDPASGVILSVSIVAEVQGNSNLERAATLVQYRTVQIAGHSIACPVHSLALSHAPASVIRNMSGATTEWLTEDFFTNYHLFATTARIVGQASANPDTAAASDHASSEPGASDALPLKSSASSILNGLQASADTLADVPLQTSSANLDQPTAMPRPAPAAAAIEPAVQPATNSSITGVMPNLPAASEAKQPEDVMTLSASVNEVRVSVVVRDGHGKSIGNLQKRDFSVFDDGKLRPLSGFLLEQHAASVQSQDARSAVDSAQANGAHQDVALARRFVVLVFDDLHLTVDQNVYAQNAAIETLNEALTRFDLAAVVSTSGKVNSGLTSDRSVLIGAIREVRPQLIYRQDKIECPSLNSYQADLIANKHDPTAIADAVQQVLTICNPARDRNVTQGVSASLNEMPNSSGSFDPVIGAARNTVDSAAHLVLQRAEQDANATYASLRGFVTKLSKLPGQKTMIVISPGFASIDSEDWTKSRLIDLANESGVTLDALNASGVTPAGLQASDDTNKIKNPVLKAEYRERRMQSDEIAMQELADGAGGSFIHNDNDLAAGLRELLNNSDTVYLLEFSLDGVRADGVWHRLSVKTDRNGVHVQARHGYFAPSTNGKHPPVADDR